MEFGRIVYSIRFALVNDDFRAQERIFFSPLGGGGPKIRDFRAKHLKSSIFASFQPIFFKLGMKVDILEGSTLKFFQIFLTSTMTLNLTLKISNCHRKKVYGCDRKKKIFFMFLNVFYTSQNFFRFFQVVEVGQIFEKLV